MATYILNEEVGPVGYRYVHMANHIKKRIEMGELKFNTPLPAERRLAEEYSVSLGTARRATEELRQWGLVYTLRSKGTFVGRLTEQPQRQPASPQPTKPSTDECPPCRCERVSLSATHD